MLGHSMGTLHLYEILHEVQKHLGGGGGGSRACSPQKIFGISQPPRSVLRPYRTAVYVDYTAKSRRYGERMRLGILWIYLAILCRSISRLFSAHRFGINNDRISADNLHTCTGGARPLFARARAPVCPSLATPLGGRGLPYRE